MPGPLTEEEKARVRHHTGYPEVTSAASISFGIPRPAQVAFLLESAMNLILGTSVDRVRQILQILDDIEQQMVDAQCYLVADQLEELKLAGSGDSKNRLVTDRLESEYVRWAERLVDIFGVPLYPFSARFKGRSGGRRVGNIAVR
jgi:hypothetical protein